MSHSLRRLAFTVLSLSALAPSAGYAQEERQAAASAAMEEILVTARAERKIGVADAATAGAVAGTDLTTRPVLRTAQLLEVVPGMIAAQHSGSGKANQYFLRGINLDHGTDFTNYFDDVPLNLRTHGHGQGYLDLNGIIPETVTRIDYRKGPYRADAGDFALAGASYMKTVDRFEQPFVTIEGGSFDHKRLVFGGSTKALDGEVTGALQLKTYDGPWQQPEDLRHISGYGRYARDLGTGRLDLSVSGYFATWKPTEQIPERAIGHTFSEPGNPTITCRDVYCAIDPTARGETTRFIVSGRYTAETWRSTVYAQFYQWHMSSNPTFFLDDPANGDQILQMDRRWTFGGRIEKDTPVLSNVTVKTGMETRYDIIPRVGVEHTAANVAIAPISMNSVREFSASPYVEVTWTPLPRLRIMVGGRGEFYSFDVRALNSGASAGSKDAFIATPKAVVAYKLLESLELYADWGQGIHSNDARGVVNSASPVPGLVEGTGKELGLRYQQGALTLTAAYWWLDIDSELKFVGDSNSVEPSSASAREGYEITAFWKPYPWLALDAVWTGTHARFADPSAPYIPGSLENVGEFGASAVFEKYEASTRIRYVGAYPLIEDNSLRAEAEMEVNFRLAWKPSPHVTVYAELLNALDHDGKDMQYVYTSRLPGEAPEGVDGIVSRVEEPRTVRVGVTLRL